MPRARLRRFFRHGLLPQLIVFEAVARLGSVTRAAEELHLAQPTVSLQLKKLAETLEVPKGTVESRLFRARMRLRDWLVERLGAETAADLLPDEH